jgi:hypothetical protein
MTLTSYTGLRQSLVMGERECGDTLSLTIYTIYTSNNLQHSKQHYVAGIHFQEGGAISRKVKFVFFESGRLHLVKKRSPEHNGGWEKL